jgi:hypothetical protein
MTSRNALLLRSLPALPVALALTAALAGLAPAPVRAQMEHDRHLRVAAYLALGLGGEWDGTAGSLRSEGELDATVGFGVRAEVPVFDFLTVGGMLEGLTYEPSGRSDTEREWAFNFDLLVRVRYIFEVVRGQLFLEPYVGLPIGFTFAMLPAPSGGGDEAWPGWNTGVLGGLAVLTSSRFGGFFELGWRHLEVHNRLTTTVPIVGEIRTDLSVVVNELALNVGAMFLLD